MQYHAFFLLGFCFLLTHEMDAVRVGEWRMFPWLSTMRDGAGYLVFAALHVPLYALLLLALFGGGSVNVGAIVGLDVFFVIHVFLHLLFVGRASNRFSGVFSWVLILGAGVCGTTDLLLLRGE